MVFRGKYAFLSNFWPVEVFFEGRKFPSVENAYQAAKTIEDREFYVTCTAIQAKRRSKIARIREDWIEVRLSIMEELLRQKFAKNTLLWSKLKETGSTELIETNSWHDNFWGSCECSKCKNCGRNNLGIILMKIRDS